MATKKKPAAPAATKPKRRKKPAPAPAPVTGTDAAVVLQALRAKQPTLSATQRAAFRSLADDTHRAELGRQTKARSVLAEAVTWAVTIDKAITTFPAIADDYSPRRFAYFLESELALDAVITQSAKDQEKLGAARGTAATKQEQLAKAYDRLVKRMGRYAGKREAEAKDLSDLPALGRTREEMRGATERAAALATKWMARTAAKEVHLRDAAGLTQLVLDEAQEAAKGLGQAAVGATLEGRKAGNDAPIVNLEEGNVLLEMMYAKDVFDELHEANDTIPRLIPGPGTRHVLSPNAKPAAAAATEPAPADAATDKPKAPTDGAPAKPEAKPEPPEAKPADTAKAEAKPTPEN